MEEEVSVYRQQDGQWRSTVTVVRHEQYDKGPITFDGTLEDVISSFTAVMMEIPEQFRSSATCEISSVSSYDDSHYAFVEVKYRRPATEAEIAKAEAAEADRKARHAYAEREMYERLKAKFG